MPAPPLEVQLGDITEQNVLQLKTLNVSALPVRYTDKFYRELVLHSPPNYLKYAFWNGFAVGAVCSRREPHAVPGCFKIYIMTIAVLPAYRRRKIATKLLEHILNNAEDDSSVIEVYLHVQTSNEEARQFYLCNGFEQTGMIENYYKRIDPPHCYILRKILKGKEKEVHEAEKTNESISA